MKRYLVFFVVHVAVWTTLVRFVAGGDRVPYDKLGDASTPWVRQFVVALLAVLVLQVVFIARQGIWEDIVREPLRSARKTLWIPALLVLFLGFIGFLNDGLSDAPSSYWIGMTATVVLVGVTEEVTFRGILVVGARRTWSREGKALVLSSVLFGLFHLPNWLLGQDFGTTIRQVVLTALVGSAFYALRRASGSLLACIALHAVYDWMLVQGAFGPP